MDAIFLVVIVTVIVALAFDVVNGFHDAANSIATVVSTRVLTPKQAVAWAAFFNFAAFIFFGTKVAETIASVTKPGTFTNSAIWARSASVPSPTPTPLKCSRLIFSSLVPWTGGTRWKSSALRCTWGRTWASPRSATLYSTT